MVIVLIHWKILPDKVDDFLAFWKEVATIKDRSGLTGEFLSAIHPSDNYDWITWDLTAEHDEYVPFMNVGLWRDVQTFHDQIGRYFPAPGNKQPFEYEERVRALLDAQYWRRGLFPLPQHDSDGVR